MYHIEVITNPKLPWRKQRYHWHIISHGKIILTSETYHNFDDCCAAAKNLYNNLYNSTYHINQNVL